MPNAPHTNRLVGETSPYLLQHAHNPVNWFPWGDEAFAEARRRGVPVFLSIGYSTCYWCHVMERESFENEAIATVMNERFVCIKADREERPDLDELYMAATTIFTGSGGWPMSVFLEPATRKPFYAGTYFPPAPMHGRPAFPDLLRGLSDAWSQRRDEVIEQSQRLAEAVAEQVAAETPPVPVGESQITAAATALLSRLDRTHGGFSHAPKFPQPVFLDFLLDMREVADAGTRGAIDLAVRKTLDTMAIGGIHDQIGGGFHRYSVDEFWTVPHFEKMLYDNAQLASVYTRAAAVYDEPSYARVAQRTLDYALREMTDPNNPGARGFFSAQDAEVDGREGLNYLWTREDIESALADHPDLLAVAIELYGLDASPNFRDPHHPDELPRFVLRLADPSRPLPAGLDALNAALLAARGRREQPALDDKVLVSWNGLLIAALVDAGTRFGRGEYLDAAARAARFILGSIRTGDGQLARAWRDGHASIPALLEDYAFFIAAMLRLHAHSATRSLFPLDEITALADEAHALFADDTGAYHDTRAHQPDLFVRARSVHDGALPSASGVMLHNLIELGRVTGEEVWRRRAADLLRSISPTLAGNPLGAINSTRALLAMLRDRSGYEGLIVFVAPGETGADEGRREQSPVKVFVTTDTLTVTDDAPASMRVALEIEPPHHIVAADPGDSEAARSLLPLRVGLISGQGVAVYADYPEGEPMGVDAVGVFNAHGGRVEFDIALEKADGIGATPGKPVLGISFQACSDTECLRPRTVRLAVDIVIE